MKKLLFVFCLIVSASSFATEFDGYLVKFKNGVKISEQKIVQSFGELSELNLSFGNFAKLNNENKISDEQLEELSRNPNIEYIEPNYTYSIQVEENPSEKISYGRDNLFAKQWGLKNNGTNSSGWITPGKAGEDINAEKAWELQIGSSEIIIAVIDTGVGFNHPDLQGNLWINQAEQDGEAGVDDDGNGYVDDIYGYDFINKDSDPTDGHGHGTHCAGVIAAGHDNGGIKGVMSNAKIMGLKFLGDNGSGTTAGAIEAINYAVNNGAHILSNSWGGGPKSQALEDAIIAANDKGIFFVAAAGNSRNDNDQYDTFPANYDVDNVISVGAMDGRGRKASFSNYGKESVDVFAPGWSILSTVKNSGYKKMSGTSMATPFVSGILGLALSHSDTRNVLDLKQLLIDTTVKNRSLGNLSVGGRVDAFKFISNL